MYVDTMTYSWNEIRNGVVWLGRAIRRQFVKLRGWLQWHLWGQRYARMSVRSYEIIARRRRRDAA